MHGIIVYVEILTFSFAESFGGRSFYGEKWAPTYAEAQDFFHRLLAISESF
jgi:hypothetical protein